MAKQKQPPVRTEEERLADALREVRNTRINEPTIFYKIGELVHYGAMDRTEVVDVLDGGKILKVKIWYRNKKDQQNAGKLTHDGDIRFIEWHRLAPNRSVEEASSMEQFHYEDDFHLHFMQSGISSLFDYYYRNNLNMEPDYQRGHIWTHTDKVSLIDSIFNNIDIGKFVFIFTGYVGNSHYEVLDGKQRMTALVEFYEGRFKYRGKTFYEMHWRDQCHFENYHIVYARTENVMTNEQRYRYFLKMNTQGHAQDPTHIEYVKNLLKSTALPARKD